MFRISREIDNMFHGKENPGSDVKIAIWNLTQRCNLRCEHCYSSAVTHSQDVWTLPKIETTADDLVRNGFKFVILSGGEPLLRKDIFEISQVLEKKGIKTHLSTNGTTIDKTNLTRIADQFDYVGISIDGEEKTHDSFRGKSGAHKKSLSAVLSLNAMGKKTGLRFTITGNTQGSLPYIFKLAREHRIPKLYLSHLVYAGYGLTQRENDISLETKRRVAGYLVHGALLGSDDNGPEVVTGNSEQDAVFLYQQVRDRFPELAPRLHKNLERWGGNAAGSRLVNLTPEGEVKPDPFFPVSLGNVFERSFDDIWNDEKNPILSRLRDAPRKLGGRCAACEYIGICNGGSRARAFHGRGDLFGEDPACYIEQTARRYA